MIQHFIIRKGHPRLILFFAGWGMDFRPFADYHPVDSDFLICYDYRSPAFDYRLLQPYDEVCLVAWSMGVWAASQVFSSGEYTLHSTAINGTNFPVDNERGIPHAVFTGTLNGLTPVSLQKFFRRMCGSSRSLEAFLEHAPQRSLEELKEELACIGEQSLSQPFASFKWDKAIIGLQDYIFAADNQLRAFSAGTEIVQVEAPHYSDLVLREIIENHG